MKIMTIEVEIVYIRLDSDDNCSISAKDIMYARTLLIWLTSIIRKSLFLATLTTGLVKIMF